MFAYKPEMVVDDDDAEETLDREVEEDAYEGEIYEVKMLLMFSNFHSYKCADKIWRFFAHSH